MEIVKKSDPFVSLGKELLAVFARGHLSAVWHCLCVTLLCAQHWNSCSVVLLFLWFFQGDNLSALDFHPQKIILTSPNVTEDCAEGRLKSYCSSPSLVGRFLGVLLASKTHSSFFIEAKFMILLTCLNSLSLSGVHPTRSFQTWNKTEALVCLVLSQVWTFKAVFCLFIFKKCFVSLNKAVYSTDSRHFF